MINIRVTEAKRSEAVTEILSTRYKYPDLNAIDILQFRYIDERTNAFYDALYSRLLIGNLKTIKNHFLKLMKGEQGQIKHITPTISNNHDIMQPDKTNALLSEMPDLFLLLIEQGIINPEAVKTLLQAQDKTAHYKRVIADINDKVTALIKEQGHAKTHTLYLWDLQQAEKGTLTPTAKYTLYNYLRMLQARRNADSIRKSHYISNNPEINAYMQGQNTSREGQIKPLISHRISRKHAHKTAYLLFTSEADKTDLLNKTLSFIDKFKISEETPKDTTTQPQNPPIAKTL